MTSCETAAYQRGIFNAGLHRCQSRTGELSLHPGTVTSLKVYYFSEVHLRGVIQTPDSSKQANDIIGNQCCKKGHSISKLTSIRRYSMTLRCLLNLCWFSVEIRGR